MGSREGASLGSLWSPNNGAHRWISIWTSIACVLLRAGDEEKKKHDYYLKKKKEAN